MTIAQRFTLEQLQVIRRIRERPEFREKVAEFRQNCQTLRDVAQRNVDTARGHLTQNEAELAIAEANLADCLRLLGEVTP